MVAREDVFPGSAKAGWSQANLYSRYPIGRYPGSSPGNEPVAASPLALASITGRMGAMLVTVRGARYAAPEVQPAGTYKILSSDGTQGRYDVAVFDNRFASMTVVAHDSPKCIVDTLLLMALARS